MRKNRTDSKTYAIILKLAFWASTIVSAWINLNLFIHLSSENFAILAAMSVTLEATKIITLLRYQTLGTLYSYVQDSTVQLKKRIYFFCYLIFAGIAIVASLGFSLTATEKQASTISTQIQRVNDKQTELEAKHSLVLSLETSYDSKLEEAEIAYKNAKELVDELELEKNRLVSQGFGPTSKERTDLFNLQRVPANKALEDAKAELDKIRDGKKLAEAKESLDLLVKAYEYDSYDAAKIGLQSEFDMLKDKELAEAGSAKMFILLARTFGVPDKADKIRFFMLLFVSFLIELTIFMTSSDVTLDKSLIKSFKKDLPINVDKKKLIKQIEDDIKFFSEGHDIKLSLAEKNELKRRIEEAKNKAIEDVNARHDKTRAQLKENYEKQIETLQEKIKSMSQFDVDDINQKMIENEKMHEDIELLKKNIAELTSKNKLLSEKCVELENSTELDTALNEITGFKNTIEIKEKQLSEQNDLIKQLEEKITSLKKEKRHITNELKKKEQAKPEPDVEPETKIDDTKTNADVNKEGDEPVNYYFGRSKKSSAEKFHKFIDCFIGNGSGQCLSPEAAAVQSDTSTRALKSFMNILMTKDIDGQPIITEVGGKYFPKLEKDMIISKLFEIV